jgi:hypothetical protein
MRNTLKWNSIVISWVTKYHEFRTGDRNFVTKPAAQALPSANARSVDAAWQQAGFRRLGWVICIVLATTYAGAAAAQAVDSVDVERIGNQAEISIRFITQIQYLRHTPPDSGRSLRVYVRLTGPGVETSDLAPETTRLPKVAYLPQFSVAFPESDGSMLIIFDQPTTFSVRPKPDGRSISVLVPVLPGS